MPTDSTRPTVEVRASAAPTATRLTPSQAFELVRDDLLALDARTLRPINADIAAAGLMVVGVATEIATHRAALVRQFGEEMAKSVDRLEIVARAAIHIQADYQAVETGAHLQPLSTQVIAMREALLAELRALIAREVLPAGVLGELASHHGFKNDSMDVLQLVSVLKGNWAEVEAETGLTMRYLDRAEAITNELLTALAQREQGARSSVADLRQRAFTLLSETYDDVRRMICFLRWKEGDADRIAPSFRGRSGGRRRRPDAEPEAPTSDAASEPVRAGMPGALPFDDADATGDARGR